MSNVHQSPFTVSEEPTSAAARTPRSPSTAVLLRDQLMPSRDTATPVQGMALWASGSGHMGVEHAVVWETREQATLAQWVLAACAWG